MLANGAPLRPTALQPGQNSTNPFAGVPGLGGGGLNITLPIPLPGGNGTGPGTPTGPLTGLVQTNSSYQMEALDWVLSTRPRTSEYFGKLDRTAIAAAGQSCGGLESYEVTVAKSKYIKTTGIFNSGLLIQNQTLLDSLKKPVFYFIGGPTDIAYPNAERDYENLPDGLPAYKANLDVGKFFLICGAAK